MTERTDIELLRDYALRNSEEAFATLVQRHVRLVYSVAYRQLGNTHQAEEITQAVFIILAQKAAKFSPAVVLSGWLYQTARLTTANFLRGEMRRRRREQEAYMQSEIDQSGAEPAWQGLAPLLDEAMGQLSDMERNAIVIRYFEGRTFPELAAALALNEATVQKRVSRGMEKLRAFFARRGVKISAGHLAGAISAHSLQAVPSGLAGAVTASAVIKGATASASTLVLVKGALKIMAGAKLKTAIVAGIGILFVTTATTGIVFRHAIHDRFILAGGKFTPVELTDVIATNGELAANFDEEVRFPAWRTVPTGLQVFDHVALRIEGNMSLWGASNAKKYNLIFPMQILGVPVNQKFESLYVCHCTFFDARPHAPVYDIVFRYADGWSVTNEMLYGDNVLDWNSNRHKPAVYPTNPDSKLAWVGGSASPDKKVPICFCLTEITNPLPSMAVTSIDLYSCKGNAAGCILAMTTGRAGMMK